MTKIENQIQYAWAVKRVEELLPLVDDNTSLDNPNSIELKLLSNLVADYSEDYFALGEPRFSDYISGKCEPTLKVAREISRKLNIDANIVLGV